MSDRIVVSGATGFLAQHLFAATTRPAVAWVRSLERWRAVATSATLRVSPLAAPLAGWSEVADAVPRARCLLHLAAEVRHSRRHAASVYAANVEGTRHAVRLAGRLGARLVLASTSGTVGCFRSAQESADETAPYCTETVRRWPYYHSKIEAERAALELGRELGVEVVIVRLPILLGPEDHGGRSTGHVARFVRGRLPFLVRGGIQVVDVRDVARALATLIELEAAAPIYHLGGFAGSTAEFFGHCAELVGRPVPPHLPYSVAWGLASAVERIADWRGRRSPLPSAVVVEMAAHYWRVESRRADGLGFSARPLEETLADVVRWLSQGDAEGASGGGEVR